MKTSIKKLSGAATVHSVSKKTGDVVAVGDQIMVIKNRETEVICIAEYPGIVAHIAIEGQELKNDAILFIVTDEFIESYTEQMPEYPVANSITVIKNMSQNRVVITKHGEKSWFIEKGARISLETVPVWVRHNRDFIELQREGQLVYDVLSAAKEMSHN